MKEKTLLEKVTIAGKVFFTPNGLSNKWGVEESTVKGWAKKGLITSLTIPGRRGLIFDDTKMEESIRPPKPLTEKAKALIVKRLQDGKKKKAEAEGEEVKPKVKKA
jgi:predicted site-specific integrase-resolvase